MTDPRFFDGARRAPSEDVGDTIDFEAFLAVIGKPRRRERKATLARCGGSSSPTPPIDLITERMRARTGQSAPLPRQI